MEFKTEALEFLDVRLIDGDRGKNYPKSHDFSSDGDCLFLSAKNVTRNGFSFSEKMFITKEKDAQLRAGKVQNGDIIVTTRGTVGNIAFYDDTVPFPDVRINSGMMIFRADTKRWNRKFLYFLMTSEYIKQQVDSLTSGSAVPQLPAKDLKKFQLPCIPIKTQNAISEQIGTITDKINLNNKTNQTLEQMAQALFKSWFVDFDPVFDNLLASVDFNLGNLETSLPDELKQKAQCRLAALNSLENAAEIKTSLSALAHELQANLPTQAATQSAVQAAETLVKANFNANPNILAQHANTHCHFPNEFEHNEQLGWIPKGWGASSVEDEFAVKGGSTPSTKNPDFWEDGEIHWTSPKDLSGNTTKIMLDTSRKITSAGLKKITSGLLPIDTVLMSSRAPVGYLALAKVPVAINQGYIAITDAQTLSSEYTIQWLDSVMDEIKGISGGTTFAEISKKTFKGIQLVIPSKKAVEAYTEISKMYYKRITACVQEINTLTETRDYLLPKLISGELQIPDVAIDEEVVD